MKNPNWQLKQKTNKIVITPQLTELSMEELNQIRGGCNAVAVANVNNNATVII